ncbi:MAG: hypothetical protein ACKOFW_03040 [Planctomycetaceae bacterium]
MQRNGGGWRVDMDTLLPPSADGGRSHYKQHMSREQEAILLAAYFRGGDPDAVVWTSNCDQVVTLSLFYTGDISTNDCIDRFAVKSYVGKLYQDDGELNGMIASRYQTLIELLQSHPHLFEERQGHYLITVRSPSHSIRVTAPKVCRQKNCFLFSDHVLLLVRTVPITQFAE